MSVRVGPVAPQVNPVAVSDRFHLECESEAFAAARSVGAVDFFDERKQRLPPRKSASLRSSHASRSDGRA